MSGRQRTMSHRASPTSARLHERDQLIAQLRVRLRLLLDCRDPQCSLCAACIDLIRVPPEPTPAPTGCVIKNS